MAQLGNSRQGRASSKPGHVRYARKAEASYPTGRQLLALMTIRAIQRWQKKALVDTTVEKIIYRVGPCSVLLERLSNDELVGLGRGVRGPRVAINWPVCALLGLPALPSGNAGCVAYPTVPFWPPPGTFADQQSRSCRWAWLFDLSRPPVRRTSDWT